MFGLGPVATVKHIISPIKYLAPFANDIHVSVSHQLYFQTQRGLLILQQPCVKYFILVASWCSCSPNKCMQLLPVFCCMCMILLYCYYCSSSLFLFILGYELLFFQILLNLLGDYEFLPYNRKYVEWTEFVCTHFRYEKLMCRDALFFLCGFDAHQFNMVSIENYNLALSSLVMYGSRYL